MVSYLLEILPHLPILAKLWFYDKADFISVRKSIVMFPWQHTFEEVTHPDDQVKIRNEVLLNIVSNYIPNELKNIKHQQVPWINPSINNFLRQKNLALKSFIKKGQPQNVLEGIKNMTTQASRFAAGAS